METKKDSVLPSNKKTVRRLTKRTKRIGLCSLATATLLIGCLTYDNFNKKLIYDSLDISFQEVKEIEYGTANYNPLSLVKHSNEGSKITYKNNVDTTKVGKQEVVFEISKSGISKEFKVDVEVKDTNAPTINLKENEIAITEGENFDLNSNIEDVIDSVDGNLALDDETSPHYTIESDLDSNKPGEYNVTVKATDSNNNITETTYKVKVQEKPKVQTVAAPKVENYTNNPATVDTTNVITAATSLIGTKYRSGGTTPETGFDCSGFVKYVYSLFGVNLSGGSSSQLKMGQAISENNLQAGDIIIWANNGSNSASHSSIYAGDGSIIHATTNKGVQKSNLNSWKTWGQHIIGIRRV